MKAEINMVQPYKPGDPLPSLWPVVVLALIAGTLLVVNILR